MFYQEKYCLKTHLKNQSTSSIIILFRVDLKVSLTGKNTI